MTLLKEWTNRIICGDCLELMKQLPDGCVHCCVTSPPYFGLRDYQANGQFGLEKTPEEYVSKMVEVFREVRRILHPTGTVFLNLGDSYWGGKGQSSQAWSTEHTDRGVIQGEQHQICGKGETRPTDMSHEILKPKDLLEMPSRLVLALQADGWWLRARIPWLKRNAMPESVQGSRWERHRIKIKAGGRDGRGMKRALETPEQHNLGPKERALTDAEWIDCPGCPKCDPNDGLVLRMSAGRPTQAVEYVFLLQKSPQCFYDGEAVRVANSPKTLEWSQEIKSYSQAVKELGGDITRKQPITEKGQGFRHLGYNPSGRSRRNSDWFFESWQGLWTDDNGEPLAFIVNPMPYKQAHFATFPPGLVIPCLKAGTSEKGCCPECGNPWVRVVDINPEYKKYLRSGGAPPLGDAPSIGVARHRKGHPSSLPEKSKTLGWRPTCSCGKEPVPCIGFDPFMGSGTVAEVAQRMGRRYLGFELKEKYVKDFCAKRLAQEVMKL